MKLYEKLPCSIELDGKFYKFKASFRGILACYDIMQDKDLEDIEKIMIIYECLFTRWSRFKARKKDTFFKCRMVIEVFELLNDKKKKGKSQKVVDFEQDSRYIYAGFYQCYGIDLFKVNLHWWQFISLFNGLSNDTKIMQIIDIRQRPIPKPTKYNADERMRLMRLKAEYQLEMSQEEREKQFADNLNGLFDALKGIAEKR